MLRGDRPEEETGREADGALTVSHFSFADY